MRQESKQFGVKATNSFKKDFHQSLLKLSLLYGTILITILFISGLITFNEFSSKIGRRFRDVQPTITIQLPNGDLLVNRPSLPDKSDRNKPALPTAEEIREDLIASLIFVNGILLLLASIASYWLARRTLRPIQDSYERQRRFLGDASHELRTPLSILQIELENDLHGANEKQRDQILSKLDEVKRMSKLVGDLLTISRLDEGKQMKNTQRQVLGKLEFLKTVEDIASRLSPLAKSRDISILFNNNTSEKSNFSVSIDEDLFSQALTNLIKNAIFYNKKDGTVTIGVSNNAKKISIEIKDNGIGISKQDLEQIFDRFFRADKSRTRKNIPDEGSGLGLSIAKSALLYMGGNLEIQSELHIGTTVQIELRTI